MSDVCAADHIKKEEVLDEDEDEEDGSPDDNEEVEQTEFHDTVNVKVSAMLRYAAIIDNCTFKVIFSRKPSLGKMNVSDIMSSSSDRRY